MLRGAELGPPEMFRLFLRVSIEGVYHDTPYFIDFLYLDFFYFLITVHLSGRRGIPHESGFSPCPNRRGTSLGSRLLSSFVSYTPLSVVWVLVLLFFLFFFDIKYK